MELNFMKKCKVFRGAATALVTPMKDGRIDYESTERLIEWQIDRGIDALVIGGTTGEAATLTDEERYRLFQLARDTVGGRVPLIFGTGTNDTAVAVRHTARASEIGCDGVLVVTPYYNRGTRGGILRHYQMIAGASDVPVILYNVPSRTGCNLDIDTLTRLSEIERIVGIKEASDSLERFMSLSTLGDSLQMYSGNDTTVYPVLSLGGLGVISVVSNIYPKATAELCKLYFTGKRGESLKLQGILGRMSSSLFVDTNPAPLKYAMSRLGLCSEEMRLPLYPIDEGLRTRVDRALERAELELGREFPYLT